MKALIFAAGLGTRLKPLTDTIPKALVPVGGKPLLQHTIEKLKTAGYDEIIINVHHFGEQIIQFVETNHHFGMRIEFSDEREKLLDTGGGIKRAAHFFDDDLPFLVHNVDILSNIDLQKLYDSFIYNPLNYPKVLSESKLNHVAQSTKMKCSSLGTLVCSERKTTRYFLFDNENRLKGWINEKTGEIKSPYPNLDPHQHKKLAFAGIHLLHPTIFNYMVSFPDRFSIVDFYLSVCDKETISCYIPDTLKMIDVGKIDSLTEAECFLNEWW